MTDIHLVGRSYTYIAVVIFVVLKILGDYWLTLNIKFKRQKRPHGGVSLSHYASAKQIVREYKRNSLIR